MSTLVVDGGAVADGEGNIHTWHGARGQRPMPRKLRGADPVLAPHQKGRPVPTAWPEMFWSRVEVEACLATLGDQSNWHRAHRRRRAEAAHHVGDDRPTRPGPPRYARLPRGRGPSQG